MPTKKQRYTISLSDKCVKRLHSLMKDLGFNSYSAFFEFIIVGSGINFVPVSFFSGENPFLVPEVE